jgi:hypothetical protein
LHYSRSPSTQCCFDLALESLATHCKVAIGRIAYLPDDLFIQMRFEQSTVGFESAILILSEPKIFFMRNNQVAALPGALV